MQNRDEPSEETPQDDYFAGLLLAARAVEREEIAYFDTLDAEIRPLTMQDLIEPQW